MAWQQDACASNTREDKQTDRQTNKGVDGQAEETLKAASGRGRRHRTVGYIAIYIRDEARGTRNGERKI